MTTTMNKALDAVGKLGPQDIEPREPRAAESQLARALENEFGGLIDKDEPISGAEAVDTICRLAPLWRALLKKPEGPK